jgi:hypothetical protein
MAGISLIFNLQSMYDLNSIDPADSPPCFPSCRVLTDPSFQERSTAVSQILKKKPPSVQAAEHIEEAIEWSSNSKEETSAAFKM